MGVMQPETIFILAVALAVAVVVLAVRKTRRQRDVSNGGADHVTGEK